MGSIQESRRSINDSDIQNLKDLLSSTKAKVLAPSDTGYDKSIERWSSAAEKPAGVAIVPTTSEEVAIATKYANEHYIDVAVKGGGHSTAGASSTNGGLLIDLGTGMKGVRVNAEKSRIHVEGGAIWGDVDEAGWKYGIATVGGTVADTGVGGLTLGGGYGVLSGERGLVIDNMVSATVVTANGEIKHASETENADLFWALRGAGQNYGVTTEFVLQAYPQKEMFIGTMLFAPTPQNISLLCAAVNDLHQVKQTPQGPKSRADGRTMSLLALAKPPPAGGQTMILLVISCNGTESEGRALYQAFLDIGPAVAELEMAPYTKVNRQVPALAGMRSSMKGAAFVLPLREQFVDEVLAKYESFMSSCDDAGASIVAWELYDPSVVATTEKGCFANRGYHLNSLIMPMWTKPENDKMCRQYARDVSNMFKKEIEEHGETPSDGIEGGASIRGKKGAVLLYGNYDVSPLAIPGPLRADADLLS